MFFTNKHYCTVHIYIKIYDLVTHIHIHKVGYLWYVQRPSVLTQTLVILNLVKLWRPSHDLGTQKVAEERKSRLVKYYDLASFMIVHVVPKEWRGYRPTVHLVWRGAERSEFNGEKPKPNGEKKMDSVNLPIRMKLYISYIRIKYIVIGCHRILGF